MGSHLNIDATDSDIPYFNTFAYIFVRRRLLIILHSQSELYMKSTYLFLCFVLSILFSCQSNLEKSNEEFARKFEGDWKLKRLTGEHEVADSVVEKFPVTLNVKDSAFLFKQATQYGQATYRNWIFDGTNLLLPYSTHLMGEDTLNFRLLELNEKELVLERQNKDSEGLDTLYFEKY